MVVSLLGLDLGFAVVLRLAQLIWEGVTEKKNPGNIHVGGMRNTTIVLWSFSVGRFQGFDFGLARASMSCVILDKGT